MVVQAADVVGSIHFLGKRNKKARQSLHSAEPSLDRPDRSHPQLCNWRTKPRSNQANEEQHEKHEKQYLRDIACRAGDSAKAQDRSDQGDH